MKGEKIKMRINNEGERVRCQVCNTDRKNSLEMFDLAIAADGPAPIIIRICDLCCDKLLTKMLKGVCHVNDKVKSRQDMKVIRNRRKSIKLSSFEEEEEED